METIKITLDEYQELEENINKIQYERTVFKNVLRNLVEGMEKDDYGRVYLSLTAEQKEELENVVENML